LPSPLLPEPLAILIDANPMEMPTPARTTAPIRLKTRVRFLRHS
jgi:hypothetical protein